VLGENAASFILSSCNNATGRRTGIPGYVTVDLKVLYRSRVTVDYSEQLARLAKWRGLDGSNLPICVFPKIAKFDTAVNLVFVITVFNIGATVAAILVVVIIIIIFGISFVQGIYTYIPEKNHVPREHCVATVLM
jgi:hypothetical protein